MRLASSARWGGGLPYLITGNRKGLWVSRGHLGQKTLATKEVLLSMTDRVLILQRKKQRKIDLQEGTVLKILL